MDGINEELSIEYAVTRRQFPGATADAIAAKIIERLSPEQRLALAEEALLWHHEPATRRDLALMTARNFVLAIESDPEDTS